MYKYLLVLVVIVTGFAACKSKSADNNKPKVNPPVIVDVMLAQKEAIEDVVEANGTVVANEFLEIHPEVSGRLTYLNIAEGSAVAQGTILAKINDADLRAQLAKAKVQLDLAETTVKRYKQLLDANGLNQSDYDVAVNQVNSLKADMVYTQALIDKTVIKAPFSGVIGLRQVSPGAYVTPASILATLQQVSKVKIDFTLPQVYSDVVKKGDFVDVIINGNNEKTTRAQVIATEPGADVTTRNLKVRAVLADGKVNPGAFVKVNINVGKGKTSFLVPTNCILPDDRSNQVIVVKNGIANFTNVQTGIRQANAVEVLSGLNAGDSVVVTGVLFLRPKGKVKVRSVKKLADIAPASSSSY
ncbi:efflux RND transporter periplasmic adaptor subunit [Ferruginibacter yonginensis]|uniref:Efflux RND transporter periplasmic adaptor subunit n=1 Tax=Ferruginibacter yonginensis TaxID=1310416 RepID=A0ABV8QPQ1_9BACT